MNIRYNLSKIFVCLVFCGLPFITFAQTEGEIMFTGFDADTDDGISFVALVDIPDNTFIHFNDNEWNELPIGGGGAFSAISETEMTWQNNTGSAIAASTVITITNLNSTPIPDIGTVTTGNINASGTSEVIYMFLGTDRFTPTTFLSAIANNGFSLANGSLVNTGLTAGVNAISITGNEDVMVYTNNTNCNSSVAACAAIIANAANWATEDGSGDQSVNAIYPDFPINVCDVAGTLFYPSQYYYSLATGDWDANTSWSLTSDGSGGAVALGEYPRRTDNVVIRSGHTITINATDDNKSCGVSPDGLSRANVGDFASSDVRMFYQTGDIIIDAGGILNISVRTLYEGYTYINGTLTSTTDIVNLGNMETTASATFSTDDDFIISGNSITILNNTSSSDDDLYIDWTDAQLCGSGVLNIGADAGSPLDPTIQYLNSATEAQICSDFTVSCTVNCGGFTAPVNTGSYTTGVDGPGGVGDSVNNGLWLKADDISAADGSVVASWPDASGNNNDAAQSTSGREPLYFSTSSINTMPVVRFDGTDDEMTIADVDILDNSPGLSLFSVLRPANLDGSPRGILGKRISSGDNLNYSYTWFFFTSDALYGDIVTFNDRYNTGATTYSNATNYLLTMIYDGTLASGLRSSMYDAETNTITASETSTSILNGSAALTLGALNSNYGTYLGGDYAEVIQFNLAVNTAQRIIINNYLSAKYNIALSANDVYEMDNPGNNNYDFEVAGIGQASDGSSHKDAQGSGLVRMNLPANLDTNEFLMWGHNNADINAVNTADVDGTIIEARLERVWRISENDASGTAVDVGTVRLTFDVSNLPPTILGSDLRLLITRNDALFADNDITPQAGSYNIDNQFVTFSNVSFVDGDYFTLGTLDNTNTPLPIELLSFEAKPLQGKVKLFWSTASEQNNDFFTMERSNGQGEWLPIGKIDGAGNSNKISQYEHWDSSPLQNRNYYRLKQTDFDGTSTYSSVKMVVLDDLGHINIYPNPFNESVTVFADFDLDNASVQLFNMMGETISSQVQKQGRSIVFNTNYLDSGIYIIKISYNQSTRTYKIIKQ